MKISKITATEILDSRGNPTIMAEVWAGPHYGRAMVPSGASTGEFEAVELRDGDPKRYAGRGVLGAIDNIHTKIAPLLIGAYDVTDQSNIDNAMICLDDTPNKGLLGANAMLGVSMAVMYAGAASLGMQPFQYMAKLAGTAGNKLPTPMMNILNGGEHADNNLDIQEFMILPLTAKTCADAIRMGAEVFHALRVILKERKLSVNVGDEGGFAPNLTSNREGLEVVIQAIERAGYKPGKDFGLTLDVAASEFYNAEDQKYHMDGRAFTTTELISYYEKLCRDFPIVSIEDGLDQNDWDGYVELTKRLGKKIQIVGDDFFCTNKKRLGQGVKLGACNSILIKLNQIGTVTETLECIRVAHHSGFTTVISHRSGETEDTTIADLAVAVCSGQIKTGSLSRSDRTAKYNRLIMIEKLLG
ncbi:MAG: phosphopyruvate hydratase [Firmicutes bacterium]|nr:phosphopyruvate hydratase [Bacillota bacterium]